MPTISIRISEEEKRQLQKYGRLSDSVRKALKLYIDSKETQRLIAKLDELQHKNPVTTSPEEIVRMIKEDRAR